MLVALRRVQRQRTAAAAVLARANGCSSLFCNAAAPGHNHTAVDLQHTAAPMLSATDA